MGLFESSIENALRAGIVNDVETKRSYPAYHLSAEDKFIERNDAQNDKLLANPGMIDDRVAGVMSQLSPTLAKPKYSKFANKTDALDASMPEDHPMAGLAGKVKLSYQNKLMTSQGTGKTQFQLEQEALSENLTPDVIQKTFEYKAKVDSSIGNLFNVFGESKKVTIPEALRADYDNWKSGIMNQRKGDAELNKNPDGKDYTINATLGALGGVAVAGAGLLAAPVALPAAAAALAVGAFTGGALAIPSTFVGEKARQGYRKSEAGTFHEGDTQDRIIGAAIAGSLMAIGSKSSGFKTAASMTAAAAGVGAASPDLAFDLAGFVGAEAAARKLGAVGLNKMLNAGKVSEDLANSLRADPTARKVVDKFRELRDVKAAEASITAADAESAARKVAADLEARRAQWGNQPRSSQIMTAEDALSGNPYTTKLGDLEGSRDVITKFNDELRMATPGGPNSFKNVGIARPEYKTIGRGKKKIADVSADTIEEARGQMHFDDFLKEMQEGIDEAAAKRLDDLKYDRESYAAYADMFDNYVHQGSANEALERISLDGLNRAMGDGVTEGWKTLSLGSRVQIVSAEETAAMAAQLRSVGNVESAKRLEALKTPLRKVMGKAAKESPEEFASTLQSVVEQHGAGYMVNGKIDLNMLSQDLSHYGFDSLHQFAFTTAKSVAAKAPRRFKVFQEATENLRKQSWAGDMVKLSAAGAVGATAFQLGSSDAEAGIINADTLKAITESGGKIWNYAMQKFTPAVAENIINKVNPEYLPEQFNKLNYSKKQLTEMITERDSGFPTVFGTTLTPAQKARSVAGIHKAIKFHGDSVNALEKELTKGDYTLAELRNIATYNEDLTWQKEKEILESIGIDTEHGVVPITGTNSGRFDFGYKDSSDLNLYGPGATYSTMGTVTGGRETITGGYSGANRILEGRAGLEDTVVRNPLTKEQITEYTNTLQREHDALPRTPENTKLRIGLKNAIYGLKKDGKFDPSMHLFGEEADAYLRNKGISLEQSISGPNVRAYHIKPEKPFDMREIYNPEEFGLNLSNKSPMSGEELWYSLSDSLAYKQQRIYEGELNKYVEEFVLRLEAQFGEHDIFTNAKNLAQKNRLAPDEIRDIKDFLFEHARNSDLTKEFSDSLDNIQKTYDLMPARLVNDHLKSLGYDSITHIGGSNTRQEKLHRVWIPLKDEMVKPFFSIQEKLAEKMNLKAIFSGAASMSAMIAAPGIVPDEDKGKAIGTSVIETVKDYGFRALNSILDLAADDADAGTIDMLAKLGKEVKVSPASADFLKAGGGTTAAVIKKASDAGLLFKTMAKDAISTRGLIPKYLQTAPQSERDIAAIIQSTTAAVPGQNSLSTPQFGVMTLFKPIIRGDEFKGSAAVQLAHGQSVVADATRKNLSAFQNILKNYGVKLNPENSRAITKYMEPVQESFEGVSFELRAKEVALFENNKAIKKLTDDIGTDPEAMAQYAEILQQKKDLSATLAEDVKRLNTELLPHTENLERAHKYLAARYPESRIALAAEDTVDYQKRPWLAVIMKPSEEKAVLAIKDMMEHYKERVIETMGESHVISGDYMRHSRIMTPSQLSRMNDITAYLDKAGMNGKEIIALTKLHERTKYSQQFLPDIGRNMGEYIPDVETRLMNADFWKVGKPGGWDAVRTSSVVQNSPALKSFFDRIAESAKPVEDTYLRRMSTTYASLEAARMLFALPSAPFKHAMKLVGDMRTFGTGTTLSVMPKALAMSGRNFVRIQAEKLVGKGLLDQREAMKLFASTKDSDAFVAGVINQKGMMDYLTDIEKTYGMSSNRNALDNILRPITEAAGAGIKAVETFDRTTTVLAAMKMAEKKGMTGQQAMYSIYDTILKNNFLSGQLNSSWARDPHIRALFLFQNTPFKIWERRVADAVTAGRDLKTAWGVIKATELPAAQAELKGIGKLMAQAELSFKKGMITDALTQTKDVFGNSITKQLMNEIMLVGGMIGGGKMLGMDLTGHLMHTPFFKNDEGNATLSVSPLTQAGFKTMAGKVPAGEEEDYDPEDYHFPVATFFKHWRGTTGFSLIGSKMGRLHRGDIPEQYANSTWKFLFAVPDASAGH